MNPKPNQVTADDLPEFDAEVLLGKCGVILQREIRSLMAQSAKGKLDRADSQDLIAYVKVLSELKSELQSSLSSMTDAELKAIK